MLLYRLKLATYTNYFVQPSGESSLGLHYFVTEFFSKLYKQIIFHRDGMAVTI